MPSSSMTMRSAWRRGRVTDASTRRRLRIAHAAPARRAAVEIVADDRVSVRGEMHADLVRAAGLGKEAQVGDRGQSRERLVACDGRLALRALLRDLHLPPVLRVAAQRVLVDAARGHGMSPDERPVGLLRRRAIETRARARGAPRRSSRGARRRMCRRPAGARGEAARPDPRRRPPASLATTRAADLSSRVEVAIETPAGLSRATTRSFSKSFNARTGRTPSARFRRP